MSDRMKRCLNLVIRSLDYAARARRDRRKRWSVTSERRLNFYAAGLAEALTDAVEPKEPTDQGGTEPLDDKAIEEMYQEIGGEG